MRRPGARDWVVPILVALITCIAFLPALDGSFVTWDDDKNFLTNPHYRGLGLAQLGWMWTTFHLGHFVPLSWMTLGLDFLLWGMNPRGYHLTNLLLHCANAVLVYAIAMRLLAHVRSPDEEPDRARLQVTAALAALLFSVHPLRVESVAWITERRDVLAYLFYLASALSYLRDRERVDTARTWYWLSIVAFACALLSKATSVTLPALLLLGNVYPLRRVGGIGAASWRGPVARRVYMELAPFAVLAAATVGMTFVALQHLAQLSLGQKVAVSAYSLVFYLWKSVAPADLAPLYSMPRHIDPLALRYLLSYVVLIVVSAGAWGGRRRWPGAAAAWLAFLIAVGPMLGLVQNGPQVAADRYTYFAGPFLAMLVAWALSTVRGVWEDAATAAAALMVFALGALTWQQSGVWHDSMALWTQVLHVEPDSPIGHNNMGNLQLQQRRFNDAITHYQRAIAVMPEYAEAHNNFGVALVKQGRFADAITQYQQALAIVPAYDEAQDNWGVALHEMGRPFDAIEHFQMAVTSNAENADARVNWGNALIKLGKLDEAIGKYQDALRVRPDNAEAHLNWGVALARKGKLAEAIEEFRWALVLKPDSPEAKEYLDKATDILRAPRKN